MAKATESTLLTTGQIAEKLGATPAKVKKAIASLALQPTEKRGVCGYYDAASVKKIATALK